MFVLSTVFAALNVFNWDIDYSIEAVLILVLGIFSFVFSELNILLLKDRFSFVSIDKRRNVFSLRPIHIQRFAIILFIVLNIIISFWYYREISRIVGASGYFEGSLLHSFRVVNTSIAFADSDAFALNPLLNQFLKIVKASGYVFFYLFIRNFLINKREKKEYYPLLLVAITAMIPSVMTGGRGGILQYLSAIIVYFYVIWHQIRGWHINIPGKVIRRGIIAFLLAIPIFYYSTFWLGREIDLKLFSYISNYLGGSIQLFNLYIQNYDSIPQYFGEESLISLWAVLNKLGVDVPMISLHLEPRVLEFGVMGNVYTFFRRPFHDFGIIGMCIFTYLVGILFSFLYDIKIKRRNAKQNAFSVLIYGYLFYWIVIASIDQWSQVVISMTNFMEIIFILFIYTVLTKIKVRIS
jgi:oligosaccharide repeat unit polymerase